MTPSPERPLDDLDAAIFTALQQDGRRGYRSLGRELGVAEETIRFRVNRMLREDVVQITAMIHPRHLGGVLAALLIKVSLPQREAVVATIENLPAVMYVSICSGRYDLNVQVVVASLEELDRMMSEELAQIEGVTEVEPLIELNVVKANYGFSGLTLPQT